MIRYFQVVDVIREGNNYLVKPHGILKNNRYKMTSSQIPVDVARKATRILFQKTNNREYPFLVIRETTRGQPSKLFFYSSKIIEKPENEWRKVNLNGTDKIFKFEYKVEPISSKILDHQNPLLI